MRVLITNDDGPPNASTSPYIASFIVALQQLTGWEVVVAVPRQQRSWISKAHLIGEDVQKTVQKYSETRDLEWLLFTGTPASCANIAIKHLGQTFDLVISGPNYGKNTSAAYIVSSGTVGAATEAAVCGVRSIALSYCYEQAAHPEKHITQANEISVALIKYLVDHWNSNAQVYSINVPFYENLGPSTPVKYTRVLENTWGDAFSPSKTEENVYVWDPNYGSCDETAHTGPGSDAWVLMHDEITVSPIRAVFQSVDVGSNIIDLNGYFQKSQDS